APAAWAGSTEAGAEAQSQMGSTEERRRAVSERTSDRIEEIRRKIEERKLERRSDGSDSGAGASASASASARASAGGGAGECEAQSESSAEARSGDEVVPDADRD